MEFHFAGPEVRSLQRFSGYNSGLTSSPAKLRVDDDVMKQCDSNGEAMKHGYTAGNGDVKGGTRPEVGQAKQGDRAIRPPLLKTTLAFAI